MVMMLVLVLGNSIDFFKGTSSWGIMVHDYRHLTRVT